MRFFLMVALLLALTVPCYALLDDNSTNQDQKQAQAQGQQQGQAAIAAQGQGQLGIVGQKSETNTNVTGDNIDAIAVEWPVTPSTTSKEEKALYSLFGGIGNNKTEEHLRIQQAMELAKALKDQGAMTNDEYIIELQALYKQLKQALKPQKLLGVIPIATRGCNIINVCGLLNW